MSADPYKAPSSLPLEELPPRSYLHAIVGAASGFAVMLVIIFGELPVPPDYLQMMFVAATCSVAAGVLLLLFRNLRWFVGMFLGPPITLAIVVVTVLVAQQFGIRL